jgi:hypothetical protein
MHVGRRVLLPVALVAAAALVTAGAYQSQRDDGAGAQAAPAAAQPAAPDLRQLLEPKSSYPAGTKLTVSTVEQAVAAGQLKFPATVVVSPAACGGLLTGAVGDVRRLSGWAQLGTTPEGGRADNLVGTTEAGINLDAVRANIAACREGTVSVPSMGLTGTISLTEMAAPAVQGAETVGVQQTVTFADHSDAANKIAAAGTTVQIYAKQGNLLSSICLLHWLEATKISLSVQQRALDMGFGG